MMLIFASHRLRNRVRRIPVAAMAITKIAPALMVASHTNLEQCNLSISGVRTMSLDLRGMTPLIQVFDMATSLKFYCDVLGFDIVQTDSNTVAPNHNWVC